jgi:hypothetical protein
MPLHDGAVLKNRTVISSGSIPFDHAVSVSIQPFGASPGGKSENAHPLGNLAFSAVKFLSNNGQRLRSPIPKSFILRIAPSTENIAPKAQGVATVPYRVDAPAQNPSKLSVSACAIVSAEAGVFD